MNDAESNGNLKTSKIRANLWRNKYLRRSVCYSAHSKT